MSTTPPSGGPEKTAPSATSKLPLSAIRTDGGTQIRAKLDLDAISDYRDTYRNEPESMPPVTVFHDGKTHWLADGFHRCAAAQAEGLTEIAADVRLGTQRDALLHACSANSDYGVRLTANDKFNAVSKLLSDSEWGAWSDREIAKRCLVSHTFVARVRRELSGNGCQMETAPKAPSTRKATRQGKTYDMKVQNIGKAPKRPVESLTKAEDAQAPVPSQAPPARPGKPGRPPVARSKKPADDQTADPPSLRTFRYSRVTAGQMITMLESIGTDYEQSVGVVVERLNGSKGGEERDGVLLVANPIWFGDKGWQPDAFDTAEMAAGLLGSIRHDDPDRDRVLSNLISWLDDQRQAQGVTL